MKDEVHFRCKMQVVSTGKKTKEWLPFDLLSRCLYFMKIWTINFSLNSNIYYSALYSLTCSLDLNFNVIQPWYIITFVPSSKFPKHRWYLGTIIHKSTLKKRLNYLPNGKQYIQNSILHIFFYYLISFELFIILGTT